MSINLTPVIAGAALAVTVIASAVVLISSAPIASAVGSSGLWPTSEAPIMERAWGTGSPQVEFAIPASPLAPPPLLGSPAPVIPAFLTR